jgi:hypothetical protein
LTMVFVNTETKSAQIMTDRRRRVFTVFWPSPATPLCLEISSLLLEIARSSYTVYDGALIRGRRQRPRTIRYTYGCQHDGQRRGV